MNKDLKNGLIVAAIGVAAYLLYRKMNKKSQEKPAATSQPQTIVAESQQTGYKQSVMPTLETIRISSN